MMLVLAAALSGCGGRSEKEKLQATADSLRVAIKKNREAEIVLIGIGRVLDSIDHERGLMKANFVRSDDHRYYFVRLRNINRHVVEMEARVISLQASLKKAEQQAASAQTLREKLEKAEAEVTRLQSTTSVIRQNKAAALQLVYLNNNRLAQAEQELLDKDQLLLSLDYHATAMFHLQQDRRATFYYQQALVLEETARCTRFAPAKKRDTRHEAMALYRIAESLGKEEATQRLAAINKTKS